MHSIVFALLLYILAGMACALFFKGKVLTYIIIVVFSSILILYISYIFDLLIYGKYLVDLLLLLLIITGLIKLMLILKNISGKKKSILLVQEFLTPAFMIFVLSVFFTYFITRDAKVNLWDELRLWGAFPKILHFTHQLQLGNNVLAFPTMQSYPPAMPLFIYYLTSFQKSYNESSIFWGYAIFGILVLSQIFNRLTWQNKPILVSSVCICLLIPILFYTHGGDSSYYYRSLFIDAILGLYIGYLFYQMTSCDIKDVTDRILFLLTIFILTIMKDSGIMFVAVAILWVAYQIIKVKPYNNNYDASFLMQCVLIAVLSYFSWKIVMNIHGVRESIPIGVNTEVLEWANIAKLKTALLCQPMIDFEFLKIECSLSFFVCFIFLLIYDIQSMKRIDIKENKSLKKAKYFYILAACLFIIGYYTIYFEHLSSFQRYMGTPLTAYLVFLLLRNFNHTSDDRVFHFCDFVIQRPEEKRKRGWIWVRNVLLIATTIFIIMNYNNQQKYKADHVRSEEHAFQILHMVNEDSFSKAKPGAVYLCFDDNMIDNAQMHHRIYFDLIGTKAYIKNFYDTTVITAARNDQIISNRNLMADRLIKESYDYIYFATVSPTIQYQFGSWSSNGHIKAEKLYAISEQDGRILLKDNM